MSPPEVFIYGAGKLGKALAKGLRHAGVPIRMRAARRGWPSTLIDQDVVILAIRDAQLEKAACELGEAGLIGHRRKHVSVLHCAGAISTEVLSSVRSKRVHIGRFHPLVAVAQGERPPSLKGIHAHVSGDPAAIRAARRLGGKMGMQVHAIADLDLTLYHASAALVANGAAALTASGVELLVQSGVNPKQATRMLARLLASVATNIEELGLPTALTGPIRRGDGPLVERHLTAIQTHLPSLTELYRTLAATQVRLGRALGEAPSEKFDAIAKIL